MAVKKVFRDDPTLKDFIGLSTDAKPTTGMSYGDLFFATDLRQNYIYSSTGGWVLHQSFYST